MTRTDYEAGKNMKAYYWLLLGLCLIPVAWIAVTYALGQKAEAHNEHADSSNNR
jgi:hypothetical protein